MSVEQGLLEGLTGSQAEAVRSDARRLLVVAGAGSGKTEVIARRIAWDVGVRGVGRDKITAFTFTEHAAEEMQFRVRRHLARLTGDGEDQTLGGMYVGTIHAFCLKLLRELKPDTFHNFDVLDDGGRYGLLERRWYGLLAGKPLQEAFINEGIATGHFDCIERFLHAYDLLNEYHQLSVRLAPGPPPHPGREEEEWCVPARLLTEVGSGAAARAFADTAARYYALLRCRRFLDFSTAQAELLRQVEQDDDALAALRGRVEHLVVDEVQDVNPVQHRLIELLTAQSGRLTAVGDHRQAIFGWRGGRVDIMGRLHKELAASADGRVIGLEDNFRSTPRIIDLCNRWSETIDPPGGMQASAMTHGRIERDDYDASHTALLAFDEREEEAAWIAQTVARMVADERGACHDDSEGERGLRRADVAILLRSAKDARIYGDALRALNIPVVFRGSDLFAQPEVLFLLGALARVADVEEFMGRALTGFIKDSLDCEPKPEPVLRAAATKLRARGLPLPKDAEDRLLLLADLLHSQIYDDQRPAGSALSRLRSTAARAMLTSRRSQRRVFPQAIFHCLLEEAGVADIDALGSEAETVMFHLGALSALITAIETAGWTTSQDLRYQVIGLCMWGPNGARLPEADLLTTPDAVSIGTIHSAKGLQWPVVFVADVRARRFPNQRAKTPSKLPYEGRLAQIIDPAHLADNENNDDERRLMYVALSRAERYLFLSSSGSQRSRFRKELEPLVQTVGGAVGIGAGEVPGGLRLVPGRRDIEAQRLVSSFSDLRYYIECPHDFYLRKVLGFAPTIDQAFGYGRGVHNLMRSIHEDPARWSALASDEAALGTELQKLVDDGLFYLRYTTGEPLQNMQRKGMQIVADYVKTYAQELAELTFEPEREFETLLPDEQVLISGAIDVVRRDDPPKVTLIDFKSGDAEHDSAVKLDSEEMKLQVSLYGIAARKEMEYEPERGLVRYLGESDPTARELDVPLTEKALADAARTVTTTARAIKQRDFHRGPAKPSPTGNGDHRCTRCDFRGFCGVRPQLTT